MHRARITILFFAVLMVLSLPILAQDSDSCPAIVQTALATTDDLCTGTARNQACYGHVLLNADFRPGYEMAAFAEPGDMTDVIGLRAIHLSAMNADADEWGVALMKLQANLPDTLPGQNVTVLLFGDVELSNAVGLPPESAMTVAAGNNINIRSTPSTSSQIVGTLAPGDTVVAIGRLADNSWLRIKLPDGGAGWAFTALLNPGEIVDLNVAEPGVSEQTPMQAFYFRSGIGDSPCAEAPDSGILIQTPEGAHSINLVINDVTIDLASTAYIEAQSGSNMTINMIEGQAAVSAFGQTQVVPAGASVSVPIDENLAASGPPGELEPYTEDLTDSLPVNLLEREIDAAEPLTPDAISSFTDLNACFVESSNSPNIRRGPGTNYPVIKQLTPNHPLKPIARAVDAQGYTWYQTGTQGWVREDIVEVRGNCGNLPVVTELPPTPTPAPLPTANPNIVGGGDNNTGGSNNGWIHYKVNWCDGTFGQPIRAGMTVRFGYGIGRWPSVGETEAALAGHSGGITLDGAGLPVSYTGVEWHTGDNAEPGYGNGVYSDWTATPGTHTVNAWWTASFATTCDLVVEG